MLELILVQNYLCVRIILSLCCSQEMKYVAHCPVHNGCRRGTMIRARSADIVGSCQPIYTIFNHHILLSAQKYPKRPIMMRDHIFSTISHIFLGSHYLNTSISFRHPIKLQRGVLDRAIVTIVVLVVIPKFDGKPV